MNLPQEKKKMYNKTYFLIMVNRQLEALILRKKHFLKWELPFVKSSTEKSIALMIEEFTKKHFSVPYKIIGESSIKDSYEWPKELVAVTGKTGEENRFIYIKFLEELDNNKLISKEYDLIHFHRYDELVEKIIFKNHRRVLRGVFDELMQRMHQIRKEQLEPIKKEEDYLSDIDKLY